MNELKASTEQIDYFLSPAVIRDRAEKVFQLSENGNGQFELCLERLDEVADFVVSVIKDKYPDLNIPYHSRWGHFQVGPIDRMEVLNKVLENCTPIERARAKIDLVVTSVLLDAGAGPQWKYQEEAQVYARSEGLAVASFNMFMSGGFSSDPEAKFQADSRGLLGLTEDQLKQGFQVSVGNPLVGVDGRTALLHSLGQALEQKLEYFGGESDNGFKRPGNIVDFIDAQFSDKQVSATDLLRAVLRGLGSIWPGRTVLEGVNLGDVWPHSRLGEGLDSLVAFHKLSQWLTYSLIEPFEEYGYQVTGLDGLTGLAEYRNGGLLIDSGLIKLRDPGQAETAHPPHSDLVIEWRALTVALLDRLAPVIREKLGLSEESFPLVKVLEGGTWWAGRRLAQKRSSSGEPPLNIASDGTVF